MSRTVIRPKWDNWSKAVQGIHIAKQNYLRIKAHANRKSKKTGLKIINDTKTYILNPSDES